MYPSPGRPLRALRGAELVRQLPGDAAGLGGGLQGVHLQEPLPGQHLRPLPALGVLAGLREGDRGAGQARAAPERGGTGKRYDGALWLS